MVRLAKAHTDLALLVLQNSFSSNAHEVNKLSSWVCGHDCGPGKAAPVTLVSWRSHRVKRVVASASADEAMGLSKAIAQGGWVRALWSEVVLGLSLREWREQENVPLISVTDSKGNYDHLHNETVGPSGHYQRRPTKTTDVLALGGWKGSSVRCL